jgi:hypothetical protein
MEALLFRRAMALVRFPAPKIKILHSGLHSVAHGLRESAKMVSRPTAKLIVAGLYAQKTILHAPSLLPPYAILVKLL